MKWSQQDREKLVQLAETHAQNHRVNWTAVSRELAPRTPNQCRTQYQLAMKLSKNVNKRWNDSEVITLLLTILQFGRKWMFIQKQYFPERTREQLRSKYTELTTGKRKRITQILNKSPDSITQKELCQLSQARKESRDMINNIRRLDEPGLIISDEMMMAKGIKDYADQHGTTLEMIEEQIQQLETLISACQTLSK